jgi:hypothetical protein
LAKNESAPVKIGREYKRQKSEALRDISKLEKENIITLLLPGWGAVAISLLTIRS